MYRRIALMFVLVLPLSGCAATAAVKAGSKAGAKNAPDIAGGYQDYQDLRDYQAPAYRPPAYRPPTYRPPARLPGSGADITP